MEFLNFSGDTFGHLLTNEIFETNETYNRTTDPAGLPSLSSGQSNSPATGVVDDDDDNLSMPLWVRLLWSLVFTVMVAVAVGGNCIVIWIVTAHRNMRTVTNYFLVNLSLADLLLSTLNCSFNFVYMLQGHWQFGTWYCTINNFIAYATVAASVFTLTGISCDRYLAIVHPLQPRMSHKHSLIVIGFIWTASLACAFPCLLYSSTVTYRFRKRERIACILVWPDGLPTVSEMDYMYQVVFLILTYVIPILLMTICYSVMGRKLWGAKSIGETTQRQLDSIRSKRKIVRMFILIVLIFAICWLPYHGYFIYTHYDNQILYTKYVQHMYLGFYWFAMSNAMVNPLIYYWMNTRFRKYFRTAICGWKSILKKSAFAESSHTILERRNTQSYRSGVHDREANSICLHENGRTCNNFDLRGVWSSQGSTHSGRMKRRYLTGSLRTQCTTTNL